MILIVLTVLYAVFALLNLLLSGVASQRGDQRTNHPDVLLLITGAPGEREDAADLTKHVAHARCVNFAGAVPLPELPLLYSISTCMITNDSGPAHFASLTEMPTFVFFGPETPTLYGALGPTTPIYAGLACSPCVAATSSPAVGCRARS